MRILDVPCGNGFYSRLLAKNLGPRGRIECVDVCPDYLARTRQRLGHMKCDWEICKADAYQLPFADETFDLIWCAQSLISLDDPLRALSEMKRVLRRRGFLAVLENDIFHHVLLPWPVDLEIPVQRAIRAASKLRFGSSSKLAPARRIPHLFERAGLFDYRKQTIAADRQPPWSAAVRRFLHHHVAYLRHLIRTLLPEQTRRAFTRFTNPDGRHSLFNESAIDFTCLNVLYEARK